MEYGDKREDVAENGGFGDGDWDMMFLEPKIPQCAKCVYAGKDGECRKFGESRVALLESGKVDIFDCPEFVEKGSVGEKIMDMGFSE